MKQLLVYRFPHHHAMMAKLSSLLSEKGVATECYCLKNGEYIGDSYKLIVKFISFYLYVTSVIRPYRLRQFLMDFYLKYILGFFYTRYDKIDIHAYYIDANKSLEYCISRGGKFDITLWGSDILRADIDTLCQMRFGFDHCETIKGIDKLIEHVKEVYSGLYDNKCRVAYFGDSMCEVIDSLDNEKSQNIAATLIGNTGSKLVITCGYNALPMQQHDIMINALSSLRPEQKEHIHAVFLMTYEKTERYLKYILNRLTTTGVSFTILDHFLTVEELASIRKVTDIVLNTQTTDALAAALLQHLYCGNVMLIGKWLEYKPFDERNVFYLKSSQEAFGITLSGVIDKFSKYKKQAKDNHDRLRSLGLWDYVINDWL